MSLIKNSFVALVLKVVGVVASYIFFLLTSRTWGAFGLGVFSLSFTVLQIFSLISRMGLDTAIVKLVSEHLALNKKHLAIQTFAVAFIFVLLASLTISLLLFVFAPWLSIKFFKKPEMLMPIRIIALGVVPLSLRFLNSEFLRAHKQPVVYSFIQYSAVFVVALTLLVFIIELDFGNYSIPVLIFVTSQWIVFILSLFFVFDKLRELDLKIILVEDSFKLLKRTVKFSLPLFLASSMIFFMGWTDTIMLGVFRPSHEVGMYSVAVKLSLVMFFIVNAISPVFVPKVAEAWARRDLLSIRKLFFRSLKLILVVNGFILFIFMLIPAKLFAFFGKGFHQAILPFRILLVAYFLASVLGLGDFIMQMTNKQRLYSLITTIAFTLNLGFNLMLIPKFGMLGAALATGISLIVWKLFVVVIILREIWKF